MRQGESPKSGQMETTKMNQLEEDDALSLRVSPLFGQVTLRQWAIYLKMMGSHHRQDETFIWES